MADHKWDVDGPHNVHLRVACGLLRHKHKSLWVQGIDLCAILQERYIFPWPVFPVGVEWTISTASCFHFTQQPQNRRRVCLIQDAVRYKA